MYVNMLQEKGHTWKRYTCNFFLKWKKIKFNLNAIQMQIFCEGEIGLPHPSKSIDINVAVAFSHPKPNKDLHM